MSFTREITLWCDVEDCVEWTIGEHRTVARSRLLAERLKDEWGKPAGWSYRGGKDRCPEHT